MGIVEEIAHKVIIPLGILGQDVSITTLVLLMWLAVILIFSFFFIASRRVALIPSGLQNLVESYISILDEYLFVNIGQDRKIWLPFLIALFSFILVSNLMGIFPGMTSPSSNINFTATLAIMVFLLVQVVGIAKNGPIKYFSSMIPDNIPLPIMIMLVPIELVGQLARPFSLAVRLFANLFAGHLILMTIISAVFVLRNYLFAIIPVLGGVLMLAFEVFVAFIQAFIFTFLSALYIGGAIHSEVDA